VRQGQPAGAGPSVSDLLELQISQAIEPALADFRQQMAQAVQQEMQQAFGTDGTDFQPGVQPSGEAKAAGARLPSVRQQPADGQAQQERQEGQAQAEQGQPQPAGKEEGEGLPGLVSQRLRPLSAAALRGLEQHTEQWLVSMLMAGLTALFAESARAAVQDRAEQSLHALLGRTFEALPDSPSKQELQLQTERTLQTILREALDAMFTEHVRTELRTHGEQATRSVVHRNFDMARNEVQQALQAMLQEIVSVLRRQWQRVLRLLLKVVLTALEDSLSSTEKEALPNVSAERPEEKVPSTS
jgi:hypothetical protein